MLFFLAPLAGTSLFRFLPTLLMFGYAVVACSNLDPLPAGVCGNYVVDPGEDCDTYPEKRSDADPWCRPAGSVGQCRYDCSTSASQCKPGWGCGADGICRASSGEFDERKLSSNDSFAVELGQFGASARKDLLSAQVSSIELRTFDDTGTPTESYSAALQVDSVARGLLTSGDAVDDILMGYRGRVLALQGSADGAPRPIAMDTRTVARDTSSAARVFVSSIASATHRFGIVGSSVYSWDSAGFESCDAGDADALFDIDFTVDAANTFFASGDFDVSSTAASACGELATSQVGANRVWVYGVCADSGSTACNRDASLYASVNLGAGESLVSGPFVGLVNADSFPDLVVLEAQNDEQQVAVAYGVGDGSFHSDPTSLPRTHGDGAFAPLAVPTNDPRMPNGPAQRGRGATLLATADLDGDGQADFVLSTRLALTGTHAGANTEACTGTAYFCLEPSGVRWSQAAVGDFNGDGLPDVAAWESTATNDSPAGAALDLFLNARGGAFNRFTVGTAGPVLPLPPLRGDFDGDLFADLALAVTVPGATGPEIQILFGAPTAPLAETAELAGIGTLVDQATGALDDGDAASDLFLLTQQTDVQLTTFSGDSSRIPISGLALSSGGAPRPDYEARVVRAGRFGAADHEDIAVISMHMAAAPGGGRQMSAPQDSAFVHLVQLDAQARPIQSDELQGNAGSLAVALGQSPSLSNFNAMAVAVADIDGNGNDELVFMGSGSTESLVQTFAPGSGGFVFAHEFMIPFVLAAKRSGPGRGGLPISPALVADVDADGVADVTAATDDGLIVIRGVKDGVLTAAQVTHLVLPSADSAIFAWANLNADPALELVRASAAGLERFEVLEWGAELTLTPKVIAAPSDAAFFSGTSPAALVAGDVTGDGIDDVVLDAAGLWLFRGRAVLR